jgi:hypothetical protein
LEQAEEVHVTTDNNQVTGGETSGEVAHTNHNMGTQPAPISSDSGEAAIVKHVRIIESKEKDRLVLELTNTADYLITLSDNNQLVSIDLPDVPWEADGFPEGTTTVVIQGLEIEPLEGGGTRVRISMAKPISLGEEGVLPPSDKMETKHLLYVDFIPE